MELRNSLALLIFLSDKRLWDEEMFRAALLTWIEVHLSDAVTVSPATKVDRGSFVNPNEWPDG